MAHPVKYLLVALITGMVSSCSQSTKDNQMGSYGFDRKFLEENEVKSLELTGRNNLSKVLIVPAWQGRVMTSTAAGDTGRSYGWINHSFIASGEKDPQFNVYGGEERFWIGPEGGPFSIYFEEGEEQVFENWNVPPVIDTDSFLIREADGQHITLVKETILENASGTSFHLGIERTISMLSKEDISSLLNVDIPAGVRTVAYQTENIISNKGDGTWTKEEGLLSIWLLCMFNPSPQTTVFIPYAESEEGPVVNDAYFGKVPSDRLVVKENTVFFRIDGEYRSKIGIPPGRARELCGSYDSGNKVLTLLWCTIPDEPRSYVNSRWGEQDDPYNGDVINAYNDGPLEDGSIMGPFYEIETSSPAAELKPDDALCHIQRVMHMEGSEEDLSRIVESLFGLELSFIANLF